MRVMSEETMASIISYIDQYYCDKHTTPSAGEISMGVGIPERLLIATWSKWTIAE